MKNNFTIIVEQIQICIIPNPTNLNKTYPGPEHEIRND